MSFEIRYRIYEWLFDGFTGYYPSNVCETEDNDIADIMFIRNLLDGNPCQVIKEISCYDDFTSNIEESTRVIAECYMDCLEEGQ